MSGSKKASRKRSEAKPIAAAVATAAVHADRELSPEEVLGTVLSGVGGLFRVALDGGGEAVCMARGILRRSGNRILPGDRVSLLLSGENAPVAFPRGAVAASACSDTTPDTGTDDRDVCRRDGSDGVITGILPRANQLIRPPLANLDLMFVVISAAFPEPSTLLADKLITIADHAGIEPVIIVSKADLSEDSAERLTRIYSDCSFTVFSVSCKTGDGVTELRSYIREHCTDKLCTFAGVSGAGKSTLLNSLFPSLSLKTGELSEKLGRGKNTTRSTELFPLGALLGDGQSGGYIADTPGFSMIDFTRYDYYTPEDLPYAFREFRPYLSACRYSRCTHTKEEGCAILSAVRSGDIPRERHDSFLSIYSDLRSKKKY